MENEREKQGGASAAIYSIVTVLVVLPILYAISSGPAFYLFRLAGLPTNLGCRVHADTDGCRFFPAV